MLRAIVTAALAMVLSLPARAAPTGQYYETSFASPAAPGATGTTGGLCANGSSTNNCPSFSLLGLTAGTLLGTAPNYYIALTSPFSTIGTYSVVIGITGYSTSSLGADWTVSLVNPITHTGVSLFTTPVVGSNKNGGGTDTLTLIGNGTFDIGITEVAGVSSPYQIFSLTYSISQIPEPTAIVLFAGGIMALGILRRRATSER